MKPPDASPLPTQSDHPTTASTQHESWGWNRRQRIGLGILLSILLIFLIIQYVRWPFRFDDPAVIINGQSVSLPQRIDPNTAGEQELARLPHLGERLAANIVQWRDARKSTTADGIVFRQPGDLDGVPGIGKKLIDELQGFMIFPDDAPAATVP